MNSEDPDVLVVCSAGGHLREALAAIQGCVKFFDLATFRSGHISTVEGARSTHYLIDPHVSRVKYGINFFQSFLLMLKLRPKVVITTGAGIALACGLLCRTFGAKLVVIDTVACVSDLSRTGRFLYSRADLFIVQWPELCKRYPRAVYGGCIL